MNDPFKNQWALVTGASSGIGRAIAVALAGQGARIVMLGRNTSALPELHNAISFPCDLADDTQLNSIREQVIARTGYLNILVHSAGIYHQGAFEIASVDELDLEYRVNFRAPYVLTKLFIEDIKDSGGQIVFINSSTAVTPRPNVSQYAPIKAALRSFADVLRLDVGPTGPRIISIYPGKVATPMQERRHAIEGKAYHPETLIQPEDVAAAVVTALAMPRTAELTDIHIRPRQ